MLPFIYLLFDMLYTLSFTSLKYIAHSKFKSTYVQYHGLTISPCDVIDAYCR